MASSSLTGSIGTCSRVVRLSVARARVPRLPGTLAASLAACSFLRFLELDVCEGAGAGASSGSANRARISALSCGEARARSQSIVARVDIGGVLIIGAGGDVVATGTVGAILAVAVAVAVADGPVILVTVETGSGDT